MSKVIEPTEHQIERLAIIRYQMAVSREQASQPAPLHNLALNTIQDFVESALHLVAGSHKVVIKSNTFDMYVDCVVAHIAKDQLSGYSVGIKAMNKARVNFKHHGNTTSVREVTSHFIESLEFVEELVVQAYGKEIDNINITAFIKNEKVKQYVESADTKSKDGDPRSMIHLRIAFDELIKDYKQRKLRYPGQTIFDIKPTSLPTGNDLEFLGIKSISKWIENIDNWVQYLSLGINMRQYLYFDAHTPNVLYLANSGNPISDVKETEYTEDVYLKCRRFVIDTALTLAQDDYDFDAWASRKQKNVL